MQSLLGEAIPVLLGLPDVDVAQTALGSLDRQVDDEALRCLRAEAIEDPLVDGGIDRDLLGERVGHGSSKLDPR